jgi:hypothetical protein
MIRNWQISLVFIIYDVGKNGCRQEIRDYREVFALRGWQRPQNRDSNNGKDQRSSKDRFFVSRTDSIFRGADNFSSGAE